MSNYNSKTFHIFLERYGRIPVFDLELLCIEGLENMSSEEIMLEKRLYKDFLINVADTIWGIENDDKLFRSIELILRSNMDSMLVAFFFRTNIPNYPTNKRVDPDSLLRDIWSECSRGYYSS